MQRDVFEIVLRCEPAAIFLGLAGELDLAAQVPLSRLLDLLPLHEQEQVHIDASQASFIDASIVGTLFRLARIVREKGGVISLVDAHGASRPIWRLTGWSELFPPALPEPTAGSHPA
jgi:anti-anti-sigma factor